MTFNWAEVKVEIERLYMKEGKSLDDVRDILKTTRNFNPSLRAYKNKINEWGFLKYNRRQKWAATAPLDLTRDLDIAQTKEAALALLAGLDSENVKGNLAQDEHESQRQTSNIREQRITLGKVSRKRRRQDLKAHTEDFKRSLGRVTKLETSITQMRRTLEDVMTLVSVQTSRPKGFASCWKQEPMTLEDAHGKLIQLPIELVVSWEMFDIILLRHFHFQALVGEKKVQKREFEIEDSTTRDPLTRKRPWSTFSKPGWKIDMSMVFKDSGKTSVVCPKCDTLTKEKKGVLVECPNPDCKMLFRTEDDEDNDNLSKPPWLLNGRSPMELLPVSSEDLPQEEADDKPGMFKRVIIRLLKTNQYGSAFASSEFGGNIDGYRLSDASSYIGLPQVQILASEGSSKAPSLEMPLGYSFDNVSSNFPVPSPTAPSPGPSILNDNESKFLDSFFDGVSSNQFNYDFFNNPPDGAELGLGWEELPPTFIETIASVGQQPQPVNYGLSDMNFGNMNTQMHSGLLILPAISADVLAAAALVQNGPRGRSMSLRDSIFREDIPELTNSQVRHQSITQQTPRSQAGFQQRLPPNDFMLNTFYTDMIFGPQGNSLMRHGGVSQKADICWGSDPSFAQGFLPPDYQENVMATERAHIRVMKEAFSLN